jgi:hypothetical protein
VKPAGCSDQPVGASISGYMKALSDLYLALDRVAATSPPDDTAVQQTTTAATQAYSATTGVAYHFRKDPAAGLTARRRTSLIRCARCAPRDCGPSR